MPPLKSRYRIAVESLYTIAPLREALDARMVTLDADEATFDFVPVADVDCETSHGVVLAVLPGCMVHVPA